MASGIGEVRLYHNSANAIPVGVYEDITSSFTVGATSGNGGLTKGGLDPGTQYWFWVELIDVAGNASAILPLGSITTALPPLVPIIGAGAVAPTGVVLSESSAFLSSFYGVNRLFDNDTTDSSHTLASTEPHWYRVDFPSAYVVTSYKLWGHTNAVNFDLPVSYQLQGSNDGGTTWTSVDNQINNPPPVTTGYAWVSGGESIPHLTLVVQTPGAFTSYRLYITEVSPRSIARVRELQLIGYAA